MSASGGLELSEDGGEGSGGGAKSGGFDGGSVGGEGLLKSAGTLLEAGEFGDGGGLGAL